MLFDSDNSFSDILNSTYSLPEFGILNSTYTISKQTVSAVKPTGYAPKGRIMKYTLDILLTRAEQIYGDKYNYDKVTEEMLLKGELIVICNNCKHEWKTDITRHIWFKRGCNMCGVKTRLTMNKLLAISKEVHGGRYTYNLTVMKCDHKKLFSPKDDPERYVPMTSLLTVTCTKCGHNWYDVARKHLNRKVSCPSCNY
jgi:ribosomal protein S27E